MDKWTGIALAITAGTLFGGMALGEYSKSQAAVEFAKAGLEECPKEIGSHHTIWVKDCIAYTKLEMEK